MTDAPITDPSGEDAQLNYTSGKLILIGAASLFSALIAIMLAAHLIGE